MRYEILRIVHGAAQEDGINGVREFTCSFYRSEILYFLSDDVFYTDSLKRVIIGQTSLCTGQIYPAAFCLQDNCFLADGRTLVDTMQVYENLFVLRKYKKQRLSRVFRRKTILAESGWLLRKRGIQIDPQRIVCELAESEKCLLALVQAELSTAPIVLLDITQLSLHMQELDIFSSQIDRLRQQGKCVIIFSGFPCTLLHQADRIGILHRGTLQRLYELDELNRKTVLSNIKTPFDHGPDQMNQCQKAQHQACIKLENDKGELCECCCGGELTGVWDSKRWLFKDDLECLTQFKKKNQLSFCFQADCGNIPLRRQDVAFVPEAVSTGIFQNLSLRETCVMPIYQKTAGRFGLIRDKVVDFVWNDFIQTFSIPEERAASENLTPAEQELLLIFRSALTNAKVILCENPDAALDYRCIHQLKAFVQKSPEKIFIFFSNDANFLNEVCDHVIVCRDMVLNTTEKTAVRASHVPPMMGR